MQSRLNRLIYIDQADPIPRPSKASGFAELVEEENNRKLSEVAERIKNPLEGSGLGMEEIYRLRQSEK